MATRTVLKSHPHPGQAPAWFIRHQTFAVRTVMVVIIVVLAAFFGWGVRQWYLRSMVAAREQCLLPVKERFSSNFEARWFSCVPVPLFSRGDESAVRSFLESESSLEALVSRKDGAVWVRNGLRLERQFDGPRLAFYRNLALKLTELRSDFLCPEEEHDPDFGWLLRVAVSAEGWVAIKCLEPGGPVLEAELAQVLGPEPDLRLNLQHMQPAPRPGQNPQAYRETRYQVPEGQLRTEKWMIAYWNRNQTPGWVWVSVPSGALRRVMHAFFLRKMGLLLGPIAILTGLALFVLRARRNAARQAALAKDRLASLTHNLKTPLAVIKAWCDAGRHGRLDQDQSDLLLIRIGEQVDQLTLMIQSGLRTLHPDTAKTQGEPVTLEWLEETTAEYEVICSEVGRAFVMRLEGEGGRANRVSLQQVLHTLLENALLHGWGIITFSSMRKGKRLLLTVMDEGPGLDAQQLKQLGLPFLRFRRPEAEGHEVPGMGLGLSLAIQIAEKEGWGLRFRSEGGSGLAVTLELRD